MTFEELAVAERTFIAWLGDALGRAPKAALDLVLQAPEDPSLITTRVRHGRLETLSLRAVGPRLRWQRPIGPLQLPLAGLELTELDVHGLDLSTLHTNAELTRLDCSNNSLQQLDLEGSPNLRVLDAAANDLMVLDLRQHRQLVSVDCSGNALSALIFADDAPVRTIRAGRNQLMVFDIGPRPQLTELRLDRNVLVHLELHAPQLRVLSLQRNLLTRLDLEHLPCLQSLDISRNRLGSLDLVHTPRLRALIASHNYLDQLQASDLEHLEELDATDNQLEELTFRGNNALNRLALADNRLNALTLGESPCLEVLEVCRNHLEVLDLSWVPNLTSLSAAHNRLSAFSCLQTPHLVRLDLEGNPLVAVNLQGSAALTQVVLDGDPVLDAPSQLVQQVPSLRRAAGLPVHEEVADMDRYELHRLAATYDAADREEALLEVVRATDRCTRGTALLVYWATHPGYYLQFSDRDDVPAYARQGWDLLLAIEDNVRRNAYLHDDIPFDPRDDRTLDPRGKDWTHTVRDGERRVPAFMTRRSG